jgi:epsilon-lactone hydrolase
MASPEYVAHQERLAALPKPPAPASLQEYRERIEQAMAGLPLAEGVKDEAVTMTVDGASVEGWWLRPDGVGDDSAVILYFHGGGFRIMSATADRPYGSQMASVCGCRVLTVDYRLAPEHKFPAAVDDAVVAYRWLVEQAGVDPAQVVIAGDSAGGGLTASLLVAIRDAGLPTPAGGVCLSPWADLTNTAGSYTTNAESDTLFGLTSATEASGLYLQGGDPKHPLASPVFADLTGLPPLLIHVGDVETLLDDAKALAAKAEAAGVPVRLEVYADMPHVWIRSYPAFPESVQAMQDVGAFVRERTGS